MRKLRGRQEAKTQTPLEATKHHGSHWRPLGTDLFSKDDVGCRVDNGVQRSGTGREETRSEATAVLLVRDDGVTMRASLRR